MSSKKKINILLSKLVHDDIAGTATEKLASRLMKVTEHTVILCDSNLSSAFTDADTLSAFDDAHERVRECLKKHDCKILIWGCCNSDSYQLGFRPDYCVERQSIYDPGLEGFAFRNEFFFPVTLDTQTVQLIELAAVSHEPAKSMGVSTQLNQYQAELTDRLYPCLPDLSSLPLQQRSSAYLVLWLALLVAESDGGIEFNDYIPRIIEICELAFSRVSFKSHPQFWRRLMHHKGNLYYGLSKKNYEEITLSEQLNYYHKSIAVFNEVLATYPEHTSSIGVGLGNVTLGRLFNELSQNDLENSSKWLQKSIAPLRSAFHAFTFDNASCQYVKIGLELTDVLMKTEAENLEEAKAILEELLNLLREHSGKCTLRTVWLARINLGELLLDQAYQEENIAYFDLAAEHFKLSAEIIGIDDLCHIGLLYTEKMEQAKHAAAQLRKQMQQS